MTPREGKFTGAAGQSMYYRYWQPPQAARGLVLIVHGAGEHCARYQQLAALLNSHGYAVAALDLPGHGKSEGTPGFIDRFEDYVDTLRVFHQQVCEDFPGVPRILLGHSMGGLISALYLLQHQQEFAGCVLSGAAIKTEIEPGFLQMWIIRFLSAVFPKVGALQLDPGGVSRDPVEVERYVNDPLVHHGKMSARKVAELFKGMHQIQASAGQITLPMLVLHGSEDPMTAPEGSRFLHEQIASSDKTLKIYPGLFHEIFNEPEREEVFADVLAWCDQRLTLA